MEHPIRAYRRSQRLTLEAFAKLVGVKKSAVSKWERRKGPSTFRAKLIEELTEGALRKEQLRPDIWPTEAAS